MVTKQTRDWSETISLASGYLRRRGDPFTRREWEDLAQDVALAAFQQQAQDLEPKRWRGLIRTISFRTRNRAALRAGRLGFQVGEAEPAEWSSPAPVEQELVVQGSVVPMDQLLVALRQSLQRLDQRNRELLLGYYAGRRCRELARLHGLTESAVKVRLHRARTLLRDRIASQLREGGLVGEAEGGNVRPGAHRSTAGSTLACASVGSNCRSGADPEVS
jgi:DNA-directed RNA polymerase specialized sigma24 family protein